MESDTSNIFNILKEVEPIIIPDNDFLPFLSVSKILSNMAPGSVSVWPGQKANALKQAASSLSKKLNRNYRTAKIGNKYVVCRMPDGDMVKKIIKN